jgi:hypothetical protein
MIYNIDGDLQHLLNIGTSITTLEEAMEVIFKLRNGLTNVISDKRKLETQIEDLKK